MDKSHMAGLDRKLSVNYNYRRSGVGYMEELINSHLFDFFQKDQIFLDMNILECGQEQCFPNKRVPPLAKEVYTLHLVLSGKGKIVFSGKEIHLKAGELFVIFPNELIEYSPDESDPWSYAWVVLNGVQVENLLLQAGFTRENPVYACKKTSEIPNDFLSLMKSYQKYGKISMECVGWMYIIFGKLKEQNARKEITPLTQKESYIRKALLYIYYNYNLFITVEDIAKNLGLNVNYFSTIFHEMIKMTPKQFLTECRMEKAYNILKTKKFKIKDVAYMVGYQDQLHFSRVFHKYFGYPPRAVMSQEE